jgi:hypothetical protein
VPNEPVVAAGANRGVEVDQLQLRERREAADPRVEVGVFEGETLALDELNHFAAAEVDGGDEHKQVGEVGQVGRVDRVA